MVRITLPQPSEQLERHPRVSPEQARFCGLVEGATPMSQLDSHGGRLAPPEVGTPLLQESPNALPIILAVETRLDRRLGNLLITIGVGASELAADDLHTA